MAGNLGFKVLLVSDATATFDRKGPDGKEYKAEDIHAVHIASLNGEFCNAVNLYLFVSILRIYGPYAEKGNLVLDKNVTTIALEMQSAVNG